MDVVLICFSQTGNTREVATAMASAFREAGHSARTISLKKAIPEDATKGDPLGVGTPCFSSRAPTPIKEFLRALPPLNDQRAFVFATSGGAPGRVLYDLTRLLRRQGADVLGGFLARGQVHHPAPRMTGQFPGRPNAEDLTRARRFAVAVAEHVSAGRSGPLPESRPDARKPRWGFYDLMGLASRDTLSRLLMPEPKPDPVKCDQCRWCVNECPMDNIALRRAQGRLLRQPFGGVHPERSRGAQDRAQGGPLQSYPVLGDQCIRCYRCLTGCPQKAFETSWRFADPFLLFLYNATFMRWFGGLGPGEQI
jgi:flavodoxin/ferredoxin